MFLRSLTTEAMGTGGLRDCRLVDKQSSPSGLRTTKYLVSQPVNIDTMIKSK